MRTIYMQVTNDKYELPIAIADSVAELSRITGKKKIIFQVQSVIQNAGREEAYS